MWVYSWCHKKGAGLREGRVKGAGLMEIAEGGEGEGIGKSVPTNGLLVLLRSLKKSVHLSTNQCIPRKKLQILEDKSIHPKRQLNRNKRSHDPPSIEI